MTVNRIFGATRYETSATIAETKFASGVPSGTVVLTTGANFPDALAGNYIAGQLGAPILLTPPSTSDPEYAAAVVPALAKLLPGSTKKVTILGGTLAVGADVASDLQSKGYTVTRVFGATRYDTAQQANATGTPGNGTSGAPTGILATGVKFPDALAAGPIGYNKKFPIILTDGTQATLSPQAVATISAQKITHLIVMGGDAAITPSILTSLPAGVTVDAQFKGVDRTDTAAQALDYAIKNFAFPNTKVFLASGGNFPDALSAGPLGGDSEGITLTEPDLSLGTFTTAEYQKLSSTLSQIDVLGGTNAVPAATATAGQTAAQGGGSGCGAGKTSSLPELCAAKIVSTTDSSHANAQNSAGTVVEFDFTQALTNATFVAGSFKTYASDASPVSGNLGAGICGVNATCAAAASSKAVNVLFNQTAPHDLTTTTGAGFLTLATVVGPGTPAVTLPSGAVSPAGEAAIGTASTVTAAAGATSAPDLLSSAAPVGACATLPCGGGVAFPNSSAITLTYDKGVEAASAPLPGVQFAVVYSKTANGAQAQIPCTGPTNSSTHQSAGGTVPGYSGSNVTIVCPNPNGQTNPASTSDVAWIVSAAGAVQTSDSNHFVANFIGSTASPGDVSPNPKLTGITLTAGAASSDNDRAEFAFSTAVTVTGGTPAMHLAWYDSTGTQHVYSGGPCTTSAPSGAAPAGGACEVGASATNLVDIFLPHGTLANLPVVGGSVVAGTVASSTAPNPANFVQSMPATPVSGSNSGQTPGDINSPQLNSGTHGSNGDPVNPAIVATYKFDESVIQGAAGGFKAWDADGTGLQCTTLAAAPAIGNAADTNVTCTAFNQLGTPTGATQTQLNGIVLLTVDYAAVTGQTSASASKPASNANGNPEGAA